MKKTIYLLVVFIVVSCSLPDEYEAFSFEGEWKLIEEYVNDELIVVEDDNCDYEGLLTFNQDESFSDENFEYNTSTLTCELDTTIQGTYMDNLDGTISFNFNNDSKEYNFEFYNENYLELYYYEIVDDVSILYRSLYQKQ